MRGGEVLSEQARWAQDLENVATFSKFLGRRKNFSPAHTAGGKTQAPRGKRQEEKLHLRAQPSAFTGRDPTFAGELTRDLGRAGF